MTTLQKIADGFLVGMTINMIIFIGGFLLMALALIWAINVGYLLRIFAVVVVVSVIASILLSDP